MQQQDGATRRKVRTRVRDARVDSGLEARCIDSARHLSDGFRQTAPPFALEPLLKHFEVMQVRERPLDRDACLRFDSGRLFIEVNSLYSVACRRAAIAHEIGHLIVSRCTRDGESHWGHCDRRIENLCDRLAVELLAPSWAVRLYLGTNRRLGGSECSIKKLILRRSAATFGLPAEMMALRGFKHGKGADVSVKVIDRSSL
jgi:Zn-dependent peptidase ImmA (M78 family)